MSFPIIARRLSLLSCAVVLTLALLIEPTAAISAPPVPAGDTTAAGDDDSLLFVRPVVSGLDSPWDLIVFSSSTILFDLKGGGIYTQSGDGAEAQQLTADFDDLYVGSETGLMGMVLDPAYNPNHFLYTCQGYTGGGTTDIRVIKWRLDDLLTTATRVGSPLVTGIPVTTGRHGGCRLRFDNDGLLYVSTGDAATGTNPQDLTSLGGKVLRITTSGAPAPGNPFIDSGNANTKMVFTYGHRNVQGLDLRPGTNQMWSVEQGTDRDDEVNRLSPGANYGYDPIPNNVSDPAYNESVPMTDTVKFPQAKPAIYTTGSSTLALSGGTWLKGPQWGRWDGAFVAAALKSETVRVLTISGTDTLTKSETFPILDGKYGRLRSPQMAPDGALYVTTSNGSNDMILKVTAYKAKGDPACRNRPPTASSTIATVTTKAGSQVYVIGTNRGVYYRSDVGPSPKHFSSLGGVTNYGPAATSWDNRRTDVFITGTNGNLYQRYNTGSGWNGAWVNLGGQLTSSPTVVSFGPRSLLVFARGTSGALIVKRFSNTRWSVWKSYGGILTTAPSAAIDLQDGRIQVGVRATDGTYRHLTIARDGGTPYGGFANTRIPICSAPAVGFQPGISRHFVCSYVDSTKGARLYDGQFFLDELTVGGSITGSTGILSNSSGSAIFGRGPGNALYRYDTRNNGLQQWVNLGGTIR